MLRTQPLIRDDGIFLGSLIPYAPNVLDIGTPTLPWNNIYANNIIGVSLVLDNNTYLKSRNFANTADLDLLKADVSDNTVLNAATGKSILFAVNGTTEMALANDLLTVTGAAFRVVPGATSFTFRNNADDASNLFIADAGTINFRNTVTSSISSANNYFQVEANSIQTRLFSQGAGPGGVGTISNHSFQVITNNTLRWTFDTTGAITQDATNGSAIVFNRTSGANSVIRGGWDGSAVSASISIFGGNAGSAAQGAILQVGSFAGTKSLRFTPATGGSIIVANPSDVETWRFVQGTFLGAAASKMSMTTGGAAATAGTVVANGASNVTVNTTSITAKSIVIFSLNTVGGTVGQLPHVVSLVAGTSFTINATSLDTSTYNWAIIETV